jgi:predicted nucleotidyltransferase
MKYTDFLQDVLGSKPKVKILRYLIKTNISISGRQLARWLKLHHGTCHKALAELALFGVVIVHKTGRTNLYKINQNNFIVKKILEPIFRIEENIFNLMLAKLKKQITVSILSAIVFGSVAEARERPTSDVDILFITTTEKQKRHLIKQLEKLEYEFILEYGNMFSSMVVTFGEFLQRLKSNDSLIGEIIKKGKVVYGKSISELISYVSKKNRT